jgi:hypothetical protein
MINERGERGPLKSDRLTCVVHKSSLTAEDAVNLVNSLLGKRIMSPRDDFPGEVEVFNVLSVQVFKNDSGGWNAAAVVVIGLRQETIDVETEFFKNAVESTS